MNLTNYLVYQPACRRKVNVVFISCLTHLFLSESGNEHEDVHACQHFRSLPKPVDHFVGTLPPAHVLQAELGKNYVYD